MTRVKRFAVLILVFAPLGLLSACGSSEEPDLPGAGSPIGPAEGADVDLVMWRGATGNPPVFDLVLAKAQGGDIEPVAGMSTADPIRPRLFDRPSWSPGGQRIAFTVDRSEPYGRGGFPKTDIYVVKADGTGLRRLTRDGLSMSPVWSPDGRTIVYTRRKERQAPESLEAFLRTSVTLWTMTAEGQRQRPLFEPVEGRLEAPAGWSPDGSRFLFTREPIVVPGLGARINSRPAIYVVKADGSAVSKIADRGSDPAWSPDGRQIVFVSDRDRNGELSYGDRVRYANELYVMDADGSNQRRLTTTKDLNETSPAWSPDGTVIAYQRGEVVGNAEGTGVFLVKADGTCSTPVAFDPGLDVWYANPAWHPGAATPESRLALRCPTS